MLSALAMLFSWRSATPLRGAGRGPLAISGPIIEAPPLPATPRSVLPLPRSLPVPAPAEHLLHGDSGRQPSLARPHNLTPLRTGSAAEHAEALIAWMRAGGLAGRVLAAEVQRLYADMCLDSESVLLPWQSVARELRTRLGGRKTFCWHRVTPGAEPHRLRFYDLSLVAPGDTPSARRPPGAGKIKAPKNNKPARRPAVAKSSKPAPRPAPRRGVSAPNLKEAA